jgi:spore coat polysaccharide biosynthesis protein SpsF
VACYRGPSDDVLSRYVGAARLTRAAIVVRITADCPLIEPQLIDDIVHELVEHAATCDYASNVLDRTYPRGLDAEAFFLDTLLRMDRISRSSTAREHVTLAVRSERPELFQTRSIRDDENNSDLRWTVDVPADLDLIRRLHEELDLDSPTIGYRDIVRYVRAHPELSLMNASAKTWDPIDSQSASVYEGAP